MATKLKKVNKNKGMSPRTKNVISNTFRGIISNRACVDNGREAPWWLAILFFLFGAIIPLIPNHVSMNKVYGASFFNSGTFDFAEQITKASVEMRQDNIKYDNGDTTVTKRQFVITGPTLTYWENNAPKPIVGDVGGNNEVYYTTNTVTKEYGIRIFYSPDDGEAFDNTCLRLSYQKFYSGTKDPVDWADWYSKPVYDREAFYTPNLLILGKYTMKLILYKRAITGGNSNTVAQTSPAGIHWEGLCDGDMIGMSTLYIPGIEGLDSDHLNLQVCTLVYDYWKGVFTVGFNAEKNVRKWNSTLIYLGVYGGLIIFLGFMVFLLTRGKNNPFSSLNLWHAEKIAAFLSFTPALLAMIFGFIFGGNMIGQMAFIMLLSLRVMWASMKTLRPIQ